MDLHAIEQTQFRGQRRVDGVEAHAVEQIQSWEQHCVDGARRLKFDFHTHRHGGLAQSRPRRTAPRWRRSASPGATSATTSSRRGRTTVARARCASTRWTTTARFCTCAAGVLFNGGVAATDWRPVCTPSTRLIRSVSAQNCVGADNLSDFVVFLFSVCAGTWFVVIYAVFELIATYSWRGGGDLGKDELSRFIRSSRFSPGVVTTMSVFRQSAATRDGGLVLIAAVSLGIALGVGILLWIYASLAKTGETNLEKSAREYRKGPDFRTYPGWTGVFAGMKRRRGLTDAAIVAELRQTGYFDNPPLADEGAVSKTNGSVARRRGGGDGVNGDATEEAAAAGEKSV